MFPLSCTPSEAAAANGNQIKSLVVLKWMLLDSFGTFLAWLSLRLNRGMAPPPVPSRLDQAHITANMLGIMVFLQASSPLQERIAFDRSEYQYARP